MIQIDYTSSKAIYEQIYDEITRLILSKALKPEDKLPSVRELATITKINPNTIQKAYKVLELENYIYTIKGKGNFVKSTEDLKRVHIKKLEEALKDTIKEFKELGFENKDIVNLVEQLLNK